MILDSTTCSRTNETGKKETLMCSHAVTTAMRRHNVLAHLDIE